MNSLERVSLTLSHKEPDRVPVYPLLNGISRKLVNADYATWSKDASVCAEAYIKVTEMFDLDIICTLIDLSVEASDFGQKLIYPESEAAFPDPNDRLIKTIDDYKKIEYINPRKTPRMSMHIELCKKLVEAKGKEKPIVAFVFGPLGITSMMRGQQEMFLDTIDNPDAIKTAEGVITQSLLDYCDALIDAGVNAIMLDTLYASQSIMKKSMWLDLEGPFVERIAKHVHDRGCAFMIHNCGNGIYFDAQIKTMHPEAISFLHLPDDCKSFKEVKEKYGDVTTLIGHISPPWIMTATKEEIEEECIKEINELKKGGGFILATGCEYPANASFDNAKVIVEAAKKFGKY